MGIETVLIVGAVAALASGVAGGVEANKAAKDQAKAIGAEATEAVRVKEKEVTSFMGTQTAGFAKSGINAYIIGHPWNVGRMGRKTCFGEQIVNILLKSL